MVATFQTVKQGGREIIGANKFGEGGVGGEVETTTEAVLFGDNESRLSGRRGVGGGTCCGGAKLGPMRPQR